MRCDVNISVREAGTTTLGVRAEIKNMNSLKAITAAIAYESQRHIDALEAGEPLRQETRRWDEAAAATFPMREKEEAHDYRYFPNPEILPVVIDKAWIEEVRSRLPEPAEARCARFVELGLTEKESRILVSDKRLADVFDATHALFPHAKTVANWIIVDLLSLTQDYGINSKNFAALMELVEAKTINRTVAKQLLALILKDDIDPVAYVAENQLGMVGDSGQIAALIKDIVANNPQSVEDFKSCKQKAFGFLVGQAMKQLGGKGDPQVINALLRAEIGEPENA